MTRLAGRILRVGSASVIAGLVMLVSLEPRPTGHAETESPSRVQVEQIAGGFRYLVNGRPELIRCMGYNLVDRGEAAAETEARYHRDFAAMRSAAINTINGWDQERYDATLLRIAGEEGMGVILHFELSPAADYQDAAVRADYLNRIWDWVLANRAAPALRIWAVGNEVFHDMPPDESYLPQHAFADFLVEAADLVHLLDPDHPVIYREAETIYVPWLRAAMDARPAARPWFIYGMNYFTYGLRDSLTTWPKDGLSTAVILTEFGPWPFGLTDADRAEGYVSLWHTIQEFPAFVLGGCAYVWYQRGPEATDQQWGLVDEQGRPAGSALPALAAAYRNAAGLP